MNKLRYLLFLSIIFLAPTVFADTTYDMTSKIGSPVNYTECGAGSYTGVEQNGSTNCWNTNTRYQGTLSRIYFNLPAPTGTTFEPDTAYRLSLYMATSDWRNRFGTVVVSPGSSYTNNFVDTFTFVSQKQVNITFTVPYSGSTTYQFLWVNLPATNTNTLITGNTNWNLSKVTLTKLTSGSGGGSTNPSGPSTSFDDTAIINSGKENTQNIINNNNSNTQDIVNNANENTQQLLNALADSQHPVCTNGNRYFLIGSDKSYISSQGTGRINPNDSYFVSSPVKIASNTSYTLNIIDATGIQYGYYCFYDQNSKPISCTRYTDNTTTSYTFTSPENAYYFRATLRRTTDVVTNAYLNGSICVTSSYENTYNTQVSNFKQEAIDNYLTDNSDPSVDNSALNEVFGKVHFSDPLSYLLTLPTQLINKIVSLSDTCTTVDLGALYGVHLTLPCLNLEDILGSDLWNTLDVILTVALLSVILKNFYDTISNLLTLGGEKAAKEKFSMPTPMDFLAMILGGDK